jgi:hypothetical protein
MPPPVKAFRRAEPGRVAAGAGEVTRGLLLSHETGMNVTFKALSAFRRQKYIISDIF